MSLKLVGSASSFVSAHEAMCNHMLDNETFDKEYKVVKIAKTKYEVYINE